MMSFHNLFDSTDCSTTFTSYFLKQEIILYIIYTVKCQCHDFDSFF